MTKHKTGERGSRMRIETGAEVPDRVRRELVDEVRRRLETGELDSQLALVETALALLDGDPEAD